MVARGLGRGEVDDHVGDLLGLDEALEQGLGAVGDHELALRPVPGQLVADEFADEVLDASGAGRPGDDGVDGDTGAGGVLGEPAADGEQRGLRHAVVDHFGGGDHGRVAGEVEHASPAPFLHAGQVRADEPDGGEDVDLEVAAPLGVVDLQRGDGAEDPEVVDEDVDVGHGPQHGGGALLRRQVAHGAGDVVAAGALAHGADGLRDALLAAAVDDDAGSRAGQAGGDGVADALGGTGDQGGAAGEVDLHEAFSSSGRWSGCGDDGAPRCPSGVDGHRGVS